MCTLNAGHLLLLKNWTFFGGNTADDTGPSVNCKSSQEVHVCTLKSTATIFQTKHVLEIKKDRENWTFNHMNMFEASVSERDKEESFYIICKVLWKCTARTNSRNKNHSFSVWKLPRERVHRIPKPWQRLFPTSKHLKGGLRECFRLSVTRFSVKSHKP